MHAIKTLVKNKRACKNGHVVFYIMSAVVATLIDGIPCLCTCVVILVFMLFYVAN